MQKNINQYMVNSLRFLDCRLSPLKVYPHEYFRSNETGQVYVPKTASDSIILCMCAYKSRSLDELVPSQSTTIVTLSQIGCKTNLISLAHRNSQSSCSTYTIDFTNPTQLLKFQI